MSYVFDYGEFLLCFGPVFFFIALIFGALLWNSWPPGKPETAADRSGRTGQNEDER
jgi:hypothetical protein